MELHLKLLVTLGSHAIGHLSEEFELLMCHNIKLGSSHHHSLILQHNCLFGHFANSYLAKLQT